MSDLYQLLDRLTGEGFSLDEVKKSDVTIAFLSLRSALRAWFTTYQSFRWRFHIADPGHEIPVPDGIEEDTIQYAGLLRQQNHPIQYFELYGETIFHFHHFFELIIKDILRKEHELLASDSSRDSLILYKLLKGEDITFRERQKLTSVEFSEALTRIIRLIDNYNSTFAP